MKVGPPKAFFRKCQMSFRSEQSRQCPALRPSAKLLTKDEARRIAMNFAKKRECESQFQSEFEHGQHQYRSYAVPRYSSGKRLRLCKTDLAPRKSARSIVGECLANEVLAPPIPIAAPIAGSAPISGTVAVWGR